MNRLAIIILAALTLCAGCATSPIGQHVATVATSPDTINTPPLTSLADSVHAIASGSTSLPELKLADLQNAQAIFQRGFEQTGNPEDKQGADCMAKLIAHLPELNALTAPPLPPELGAPVVGVFSGFAAVAVTTEVTKARIAAKAKLLQQGIPFDVHVACAPLIVDAQTVLLRLH